VTNIAARNQIFSQMEAQRHNAQYSARPLAYLSHGARFERMVERLVAAKKDGRMQAAAAIAKMARRIVSEMPV
jgi:hypothetical protein